MLLITIGIIALAFTCTMIASKQNGHLLGFPAAIFWFVFGADCYVTAATHTWSDLYYILFWASSIGMVIFTTLAGVALFVFSRKNIEPEEPPQDAPEVTADEIDRGAFAGDGDGGGSSSAKRPASGTDDVFSLGGTAQNSQQSRGLQGRADKRRVRVVGTAKSQGLKWR